MYGLVTRYGPQLPAQVVNLNILPPLKITSSNDKRATKMTSTLIPKPVYYQCAYVCVCVCVCIFKFSDPENFRKISRHLRCLIIFPRGRACPARKTNLIDAWQTKVRRRKFSNGRRSPGDARRRATRSNANSFRCLGAGNLNGIRSGRAASPRKCSPWIIKNRTILHVDYLCIGHSKRDSIKQPKLLPQPSISPPITANYFEPLEWNGNYENYEWSSSSPCPYRQREIRKL